MDVCPLQPDLISRFKHMGGCRYLGSFHDFCCYVFVGLWTVPSSFCLIFPYLDPLPLSYADYIGLPRSFLLILYHPYRRSSLVLSSGASLIPLSVAVPLSFCTIQRLTKRWYCRSWAMSPSPCYFTRSSPSAVYKDVLVAA